MEIGDADDDDESLVGTSVADEKSQLREEIKSLKQQLAEAKSSLEKGQNDMMEARESAENMKRIMEEKFRISRFGLERFSSDDESVKFYTGFPSNNHIKRFFEFVEPNAKYMTYCYASGVRESRPAARQMQLIDEIFMFLVRLKLGHFEKDLADRFNLHISSISRKVITWANYLYFVLGSQAIWPARDDVQKRMPNSFRKLYPSTRVIIDCTEVHVQTPSSLLLQSQLYSSYRSNTTLKGLIGIAPHGAVIFVSSLYTGSISDKEITRCCGILDLLEEGDAVMADKGFNIENILHGKGVSLTIPPFLQKKQQFSADEVKETKTIAKLRIHVERAIRRIKEFHFFDSDVQLSMLGTVNQLYTVACLLTNF